MTTKNIGLGSGCWNLRTEFSICAANVDLKIRRELDLAKFVAV